MYSAQTRDKDAGKERGEGSVGQGHETLYI